jgi:methyl-accepting chemotaxis protein
MPQPRKSLFPLLLPAVLLVPLAAGLSIILVSTWHARDARQTAAQLARADVAMVGREIETGIRARQAALELLSRSSELRQWMEAGGPPTERASRDMAASLGAFPGASALAASARDGVLYRDGIAVGALSRDDPLDSWYFDALEGSTGTGLAGARATVLQAAAIQSGSASGAGQSALGAVAIETPVPLIAAEASRAAAGSPIVVLTDQVGGILHVTGAAASGARTISDIFPRIERKIFIAVMESPATARETRLFDDRSGGRPLVIAAARLAAPDWRLFVSEPVHEPFPPLRAALLALAALASLAFILVWTGLLAAGRRRERATIEECLTAEAREARAELDEAARRSREARAAVDRISDGSRAIARESEGAVRAADELAPLLERSAAALAGRAAILARAIGALGQSASGTERAESTTSEIAAAATRAEEALGPAVDAAVAVGRAAGRLKGKLAAVGGLAERARLLSLNAALDAARGDEKGRKLARSVEEIQALAGQAAESARALASELAAAAENVDAARAGVESGGRELGLVSERAAELASALAGIRESGREILREGGGAAPEPQTGAATGFPASEDASLTDRARSLLQGLSRIGGRIASLSREIDAAAAEAAQSCGQAVQSAEGRASAE